MLNVKERVVWLVGSYSIQVSFYMVSETFEIANQRKSVRLVAFTPLVAPDASATLCCESFSWSS